MSKTMLVEYVRRPEGGLYLLDELAKKVMKTFKGRKAKTDVEKLIKSYINNQKSGIMIAAVDGRDNTKVLVSYAQWDATKDQYDKDMMFQVALERMLVFAEKPEDYVPQVPFEIAAHLPSFLGRARKYYKDSTFPKWTEAY